MTYFIASSSSLPDGRALRRTRTREIDTSLPDVEKNLSDGTFLDRRVRLLRLLEREVVQRQAGLLADMDRAVVEGGRDVAERRLLGFAGCGVQQHELPPRVGRHQSADRQGELVATVVRVHRDRA